MTAEQAFWVAIFSTIGTVIVGPLLAWFLNRRKNASDVTVNLAQSASEIAEGGEKAVAAAERLFGHYDKIIANLQTDNQALRAENAANKSRITALETQRTSDLIDEETRRKRLIARLEAQEAYIKLLVEILGKHIPKEEIPPMPEILSESQTGMKAVK